MKRFERLDSVILQSETQVFKRRKKVRKKSRDSIKGKRKVKERRPTNKDFTSTLSIILNI